MEKIKPIKILAIDDDQFALDALEQIISHKFEVHKDTDPRNGLKKAELISPDLILLDYMMPSMDGIEFFNEIRKNPKIKHIPVIYITAYKEELIKKMLSQNGIHGVVSKPIEVENLMQSIDSAIELKKMENIRDNMFKN